ncbi:unnamed protein product [Prorocentrum cordatum]|uniref:Right handed beta helix domain-containing protein n=1 Tax=Prorocentrum cordatum TaxID=2364126 RepID=A0ABN9PNA6_9DINO|nr:unnamed protein product [Polarella glacialis]
MRGVMAAQLRAARAAAASGDDAALVDPRPVFARRPSSASCATRLTEQAARLRRCGAESPPSRRGAAQLRGPGPAACYPPPAAPARAGAGRVEEPLALRLEELSQRLDGFELRLGDLTRGIDDEVAELRQQMQATRAPPQAAPPRPARPGLGDHAPQGAPRAARRASAEVPPAQAWAASQPQRAVCHEQVLAEVLQAAEAASRCAQDAERAARASEERLEQLKVASEGAAQRASQLAAEEQLVQLRAASERASQRAAEVAGEVASEACRGLREQLASAEARLAQLLQDQRADLEEQLARSASAPRSALKNVRIADEEREVFTYRVRQPKPKRSSPGEPDAGGGGASPAQGPADEGGGGAPGAESAAAQREKAAAAAAEMKPAALSLVKGITSRVTAALAMQEEPGVGEQGTHPPLSSGVPSAAPAGSSGVSDGGARAPQGALVRAEIPALVLPWLDPLDFLRCAAPLGRAWSLEWYVEANGAVVVPRDAATINEGINASAGKVAGGPRRGGLVLVRPGTYKEAVRVACGCHVVGLGPGQVVVEEPGCESALVLVQQVSACVRNLTLRCQRPENRGKVVYIPHGRPLLERCVVEGGVHVCGAATAPTLRRCRVLGSPGDGIHFSDGSQGTVADCVVEGHARHGVLADRGARPELRGNRIGRNRSCGVRFLRAAARVEPGTEAVLVDPPAGFEQGNSLFENEGGDYSVGDFFFEGEEQAMQEDEDAGMLPGLFDD